MEDEYKLLALLFFYNTAKELMQSFIGTLGVPVDLVLLGLGYWKRETWWGKGLLYGAITSLGREYGTMIISGLPIRQTQTQPPATQQTTFSGVVY